MINCVIKNNMTNCGQKNELNEDFQEMFESGYLRWNIISPVQLRIKVSRGKVKTTYFYRKSIFHYLVVKYSLYCRSWAREKGVVQSSQLDKTSNWISISRRNIHKMIPCEPLKDVCYRVSQNIIYYNIYYI